MLRKGKLKMLITIRDIEQGTDEWKELRRGVVTASNFKYIVTSTGDPVSPSPRKKYMDKLFDEIISGKVIDGFKSDHMKRGNEQEPQACRDYEFIQGVDVEHVTIFLDENKKIGYSPDGLIGENGLVEIKTALPHIQRDRLLNGWSPAEHKQQTQGGLYVSERSWIDRVSYCPNMDPVIERFYRDEKFIKKLAIESKVFTDELEELVSEFKI